METQTGAVTSAANNARRVICNASWMQKGELTLRQMLQTTVRITQLMRSVCAEHQSHGIYREVTTRKILLNAPGLNQRVLSWSWISLRTGARQIEQHTIEHHLCGAELLMQMHLRQTLRPELILQMLDKINTRPFQQKIEIRRFTPGITVQVIQHGVADSTADEGQPGHTRTLSLFHQ
tara:strand:+ start:235 stop:768 length:534 start_codon:yes stop_codon:yes gene_type:complete